VIAAALVQGLRRRQRWRAVTAAFLQQLRRRWHRDCGDGSVGVRQWWRFCIDCGGVGSGIVSTVVLACGTGGISAVIVAALAQGLRLWWRWRAAMVVFLQ
jgi:hypothetical protein